MIRNKQRGSSLIEVMVGLLVTAIGLLGILTMQTKALQLNKNAHLYSQATILANDMLEAMKTTPETVTQYNTGLTDGPPAVTAGACQSDSEALACSSADIAKWNLNRWKTNIANLLPEGRGSVNYAAGSNEVTIVVQFVPGYERNDTGNLVALAPVQVQLSTAGI